MQLKVLTKETRNHTRISARQNSNFEHHHHNGSRRNIKGKSNVAQMSTQAIMNRGVVWLLLLWLQFVGSTYGSDNSNQDLVLFEAKSELFATDGFYIWSVNESSQHPEGYYQLTLLMSTVNPLVTENTPLTGKLKAVFVLHVAQDCDWLVMVDNRLNYVSGILSIDQDLPISSKGRLKLKSFVNSDCKLPLWDSVGNLRHVHFMSDFFARNKQLNSAFMVANNTILVAVGSSTYMAVYTDASHIKQHKQAVYEYYYSDQRINATITMLRNKYAFIQIGSNIQVCSLNSVLPIKLNPNCNEINYNTIGKQSPGRNLSTFTISFEETRIPSDVSIYNLGKRLNFLKSLEISTSQINHHRNSEHHCGYRGVDSALSDWSELLLSKLSANDADFEFEFQSGSTAASFDQFDRDAGFGWRAKDQRTTVTGSLGIPMPQITCLHLCDIKTKLLHTLWMVVSG